MSNITVILTLIAAIVITGLLLLIAGWRIKNGMASVGSQKSISLLKTTIISCLFTAFSMIGVVAIARGIDTGMLALPRRGYVSSQNPLAFWFTCTTYFVLTVVAQLAAAGPFFTRWAHRNAR